MSGLPQRQVRTKNREVERANKRIEELFDKYLKKNEEETKDGDKP